jgi:cytochrome c oxidase cbb3-type subunit III
LTEQTWVVSAGRRLTVAASLLLLASAACASAEEADIKQVYVAKCQICHMADGNSPIPDMNFADGKWLHGSSVAEITKVIEEGVPGKAMLPFKTQLTSEQIAGLAQFVRTFDKALKPEKPAAKKK